MELNIVFADFPQIGRFTLSKQKPYGTLQFRKLKTTHTSIHTVSAFILPTPILCILFPFSHVRPWAFKIVLYNEANTLFPAPKSAFVFWLFIFFSVAKNY